MSYLKESRAKISTPPARQSCLHRWARLASNQLQYLLAVYNHWIKRIDSPRSFAPHSNQTETSLLALDPVQRTSNKYTRLLKPISWPLATWWWSPLDQSASLAISAEILLKLCQVLAEAKEMQKVVEKQRDSRRSKGMPKFHPKMIILEPYNNKTYL